MYCMDCKWPTNSEVYRTCGCNFMTNPEQYDSKRYEEALKAARVAQENH